MAEFALWKLDEDTAKPICEQLQIPFERGRLVRGAVVKANDEADYSAHTYQREESGLLTQIESEQVSDRTTSASFTIEQAREVLREVDRRFAAGSPFSHLPQGRARYLDHFLNRQLRLGRREAEQLIADCGQVKAPRQTAHRARTRHPARRDDAKTGPVLTPAQLPVPELSPSMAATSQP